MSQVATIKNTCTFMCVAVLHSGTITTNNKGGAFDNSLWNKSRALNRRCSISNQIDRRMAYGLARDVIKKRDATTEMIEYALSLLPVDGYKSMGLRLRLKRKLEGLSTKWEDM